MSNSSQPHGLQHARPPCPSPAPGVYSNSYPWSQWCHPTISSSVIPFSSCLQSFPASGSFQMSQFFTSGGQNIGVSALASVLPMNIQDWVCSNYGVLIMGNSQPRSVIWLQSAGAWCQGHHKGFLTQISALWAGMTQVARGWNIKDCSGKPQSQSLSF